MMKILTPIFFFSNSTNKLFEFFIHAGVRRCEILKLSVSAGRHIELVRAQDRSWRLHAARPCKPT